MLIFSKLTNLFFTVLIALLLAISLALSIIFYSTTNVIQDKDLVKSIVKSDQVREVFIEQLAEASSAEENPNIEITEDQLNELSDEEVNTAIDSTIDSIYLWLEGEIDSPSIIISEEESDTDPLGLEKIAEDRLGVLSQFIDYEALNNEIAEQIPLLNLQPTLGEFLPDTYQSLEKYSKISIIVALILSALLLISAKNLRAGAFLLGITYIIVALALLLGPNYISRNGLIEANQIPFLSIPDPEQLSPFIKEIGTLLYEEILKDVTFYSRYLLAVGVFAAILSQIAVRRREIEVITDYPEVDATHRESTKNPVETPKPHLQTTSITESGR